MKEGCLKSLEICPLEDPYVHSSSSYSSQNWMRCAGWKMQCSARQAKQASPGEGTGRYRVTGNISWARTSVIHLQEQQPPPSLVNTLRKQKVPVQTAQSVLTLPRQLRAACGHQEDPERGSTSSCPQHKEPPGPLEQRGPASAPMLSVSAARPYSPSSSW